MKIRESIPDFHFLNADFILLALNYYLPKTTMNEREFQGLSRPWKESLKFKGVQDACKLMKFKLA